MGFSCCCSCLLACCWLTIDAFGLFAWLGLGPAFASCAAALRCAAIPCGEVDDDDVGRPTSAGKTSSPSCHHAAETGASCERKETTRQSWLPLAVVTRNSRRLIVDRRPRHHLLGRVPFPADRLIEFPSRTESGARMLSQHLCSDGTWLPN